MTSILPEPPAPPVVCLRCQGTGVEPAVTIEVPAETEEGPVLVVSEAQQRRRLALKWRRRAPRMPS